MADCPWLMQDLLAELSAGRGGSGGPLLLFADDPLLGSSDFCKLAESTVRVISVAAPASSLVTILQDAQASGFTPHLPFPVTHQSRFDAFRPFDELIAIVNEQLQPAVGRESIHELSDLLFSPVVPRWDPFVHKLDFARTATGAVRERILDASARTERAVAVALRGSAASGKTTVLKRTALDLAETGTLVLWLKPYYFQDGPGLAIELFKCIARSDGNSGARVAVFADDLAAANGVTANDVVQAARTAGVSLLLVTSIRTVDATTTDALSALDPACPLTVIDLPDDLDNSEWDRVAAYLVTLGVCRDAKDAALRISEAQTRGAKDTLSLLYWLLPDTRRAITHSVRNEYFRLGDQAGLSRIIAAEMHNTSSIVRAAYEFVAVADRHKCPLPIEVLVSALNVDYGEWLAATPSDGAAWGLLYPEPSADSSTTVYRTRNCVVTQIIIDAVNGGTLGRSGELQRLLQLLGACTGGNPVYREFCTRVLVPWGKLSHLSPEEGVALYERAIGALPHADRTLLHHLGLWEKNKSLDTDRARTSLLSALKTPQYPYASRGEPDEHIFTSLAATELAAIKAGRLTAAEGKERVLSYLERARSEQFVNPNAVHVQAKYTVMLAESLTGDMTPDACHLVDLALADIERTLLILRSPFGNTAPKQIEVLEDMRTQVLEKWGTFDDMHGSAQAMWSSHRRQEGFVLVARKLLNAAVNANKGRAYKDAYDYCTCVENQITSTGGVVSPQLAEVALHTYFLWRVRRVVFAGSSEAIDWEVIEQLAMKVLSSERYGRDPFYKYVHALSLAHMNRWSDAKAVFGELRGRGLPGDLLWTNRDALLDEKGAIRRVQGVVRRGATGSYLQIDALHTDIPLARNEKWRRPGEIEHVYIYFAFGGPTAVHDT